MIGNRYEIEREGSKQNDRAVPGGVLREPKEKENCHGGQGGTDV